MLMVAAVCTRLARDGALSVSSGVLLAFIQDVLVGLGLAATGLIYWRQRTATKRRDIDSVLAMLRAVRDGILPWGDLYFGNGYDEQRATDRANSDFDLVLTLGGYGQVFRVPTDPLTALLMRPGDGLLVRKETIEAANIALWRIGVFNQLAQQQADFNTRHLAEFYDVNLPEAQRDALAQGARAISKMLHADGIGDAEWYLNLKDELAANIELLTRLRISAWKRNRSQR